MTALPPKPIEPGMGEVSDHRSSPVARWKKGALSQAVDEVAEEVPVAMVYNGISHVVMLATPTSLEAFGLGFRLSEGILHNRRELQASEIIERSNGIELHMTIAQERFFELKQRRRNLAGRTGCGLCGAESLQQLRRPLTLVKHGQIFTDNAIHDALGQLPGMQSLQQLTGAVHAAAWVTAEGRITDIEEDVGRHNALDKLIGRLAMRGTNFSEGFAIVTSRASYEMVQKSASVGTPMLVAVSAPTGLAIDLAREAGVTLVGFARADSHVIYAHPQRLSGQQASL